MDNAAIRDITNLFFIHKPPDKGANAFSPGIDHAFGGSMLLPNSMDGTRPCTQSLAVVMLTAIPFAVSLARMRKPLTLLGAAAVLAALVQLPAAGQARPTLSTAVRAYV